MGLRMYVYKYKMMAWKAHPFLSHIGSNNYFSITLCADYWILNAHSLQNMLRLLSVYFVRYFKTISKRMKFNI
jgi:hypothetical protein